MVDNNEVVDTPQKTANPLYDEDAAFNNENSSESLSPADAFGDLVKNVENSDTPETAPQEQPQGQPVKPATSNDDTRFQYWQSQADTQKNENSHLRDELNQMKGQMNALSGQQAPAQQQAVQEDMEFPPPPEKPAKPGGFNREEAYSDPSSASAQYMDTVEGWRDDMDEYNTAKTNYNTMLVQERVEKIEETRVHEQKQREAQVQQGRQVAALKQHVSKNYNMNAEETQDFVSKMSDPKSISMDNLVQLYRMQQGSGNTTPNQNVGQPSDTFQQTQRAQQVPQPMGVQSSSGYVEQGNTEDRIMDNIVGNYNKNNPWG
tara:strand:- start:9093 stop:10046 length:954 start_codon:yes stop_codon:yes gene_type:complete